jgi:hypothetical protein
VSGFDTTRVASHVRRLGEDELAVLVADLWAARGYETAREGTDVVASHGAETVHIRPSAGGRWGRTAPAVVVSQKGSDPAAGRAVDAAGLAEMLGYAVDRPTARDICRRHLGGVPADLPPPPTRRLRRRVGTLGTATPVLAVGVFALVLVVGVLLGGGVVPGALGVGGADAGPGDVSEQSIRNESLGGDPAGENGSQSSVPTWSPSVDSSSPPGVTRSGIGDVEALARAHERAVANRSHTVWVDWYRPRNLRPDGVQVQRDIDIASEGERYLIRTSDEVAGNRTRSGSIYHDGSGVFVAVWNETTNRPERVFRITPRQNTVPTPETVRTGVVRRYLSTPTTDVTGVIERDGRRLYRVVGTGPPNTSSAVTIQNYTVEALVDSRGFVRDVTVRATVSHPDTSPRRAFPIKREITYGRVGTTTVDPPEWYLNHTARG